MTKQEFETQHWSKNTITVYENKEYTVKAVDFEKGIVYFVGNSGVDYIGVSYSQVEVPVF